MDPDAYTEMFHVEDVHWWYVSRRSFIHSMIAKLDLPNGAEILEIGCGTGGNLGLLSHFGYVHAIEMDDAGLKFCKSRVLDDNVLSISSGSLPDNIPSLSGKTFDLICLFDVLEHIEDDACTLQVLNSYLRSSGRLFLTVPSYDFMWSNHDEFLHHFRRYTKRSIKPLLTYSGFVDVETGYFNFLLFPVAVSTRYIGRLLRMKSSPGMATPTPALNKILKAIFKSEIFITKRSLAPFGLSTWAVAKKQ